MHAYMYKCHCNMHADMHVPVRTSIQGAWQYSYACTGNRTTCMCILHTGIFTPCMLICSHTYTRTGINNACTGVGMHVYCPAIGQHAYPNTCGNPCIHATYMFTN